MLDNLDERWARRLRSLRKTWDKQVLSRVFVPIVDTGDWRRTLLVASSPRSGSTWVQELLAHNRDYRVIFEPFHPRHVPETAPIGKQRYLRPSEESPQVAAVMDGVMNGTLRNRWADRFNRRWCSSQRLVKTVRSNLLLPWLAHHYPDLRIVYLLRHPCAVAASRKQMGWGSNLEPFRSQDALMRDFLAPHADVLALLTETSSRRLGERLVFAV